MRTPRVLAGCVLVGLLHVCGIAAADTPRTVLKEWAALLHYRGAPGKWKSEVDDAAFFLTKEGPRDPDAEWEAAQAAFRRPAPRSPNGPVHAQCRFPARFELMRRTLQWSRKDVVQVPCPERDAFVDRLKPRAVSVVFASHFMANPSSAFGHTMLYLHTESPTKTALADRAIGFEAITDGMSTLEYIPRGLVGQLLARYNVTPFYERVKKYERQESRDIWLFPLALSQEQLDTLVLHLWELQGVAIRYRYFRGNCAQKLLSLMHAIAPDKGLPLNSRAAILPSEVVKRFVKRLGAAGRPIYRPSLAKQYKTRRARLSVEQRAMLDRMIAARRVIDGAGPEVLGAAMMWSEIELPYRAFRRELDDNENPDHQFKRELWNSTRAVGGALELEYQAPSTTLLGSHAPSRITVRSGYRASSGAVFGVGLRWLLHEAVDPARGYPPLSTLEAGRIDLDLATDGTFRVERALGLHIEKLAPEGPGLNLGIAWRTEIGARRLAYDGGTPLDVGAEFDIGLGVSHGRPGLSATLYALVGARAGATLTESGTRFLAPALGTAGLLLALPGRIRARVAGQYVLPLVATDKGEVAIDSTVRLGLSPRFDIELRGNLAAGLTEATAGLVFFN